MPKQRYCSVKGCNKAEETDEKRIFHQFPKDEKVRQQSVKNLCLGKEITDNLLVCSKHFLKSDYFPRTNKQGIKETSPMLKRIAVPISRIVEENRRPIILKKTVTDEVQSLPSDTRAPEVEISEKIDECSIDLQDNGSVEETTLSECDICSSTLISDSFNELNECFIVDNEEKPEVLNPPSALNELNECFIVDNQEKPEVLNPSSAAQTQNDSESKQEKVNFMNLIKSDDDLLAFTGINFRSLSVLTELVQLAEKNHVASKFSNGPRDRIVLCLCKLRLNLSFRCLSVLFQITRQTRSNNYVYMIKLLSQLLEKVIYWPTKEEFAANLPKCFKNYPQVRVVLDCTEVPVEKPGCLKCRLRLYSHYKGCETIKLLIGVTPSGSINYISKVFGGRASDKAIFNQSTIFEKLTPTVDMIMVDKGVDIENECTMNRIRLIMPPKLRKRTQFSKGEVKLTADIAAARVHVERVIQRFKMFKIVKHKISWTLIPYMNDVVTVIAALVNMKPSILSDDKFE